jgi:hypothetical protein
VFTVVTPSLRALVVLGSLAALVLGADAAQAAPTATIAPTGSSSYVLTVTSTKPLAWFETRGVPGATNLRPTAPLCSTKLLVPAGSEEIYCAFGTSAIVPGSPARVCFDDTQRVPASGASIVVSDLSVEESAPITTAPAVSGCPIGKAQPGLGAPRCVVPKVKGKPLGAAKKVIATAHCSVGKVKRARSRRVRRGRVVSQSPAPGTLLAAGAKVGLIVSRG